MLTLFLYVVVPKGFFPVQDTGVILGISEAPQNILSPRMAERQQALAQVILKDPDVESLSSFIGIDGTNTTLNSGRIQINLKPHDERKSSATEIIRRLQPELAKVDGITLYMQPVQDLTVEDRVSRTQYQYTWKMPMRRSCRSGPRSWSRSCGSCPPCATSPPISRMAASKPSWSSIATPPRAWASLPQAIDDTLYDAFGQRQVSTIFTQLNQYHVVLEVDPQFAQNPDSLKNIYVHSSTGMQVPLASFSSLRDANTPLAVNHQGQFPVVTLSFNLAPGVSLGEAAKAIQQAEAGHYLPPSIHTSFQGTAAAFQNFAFLRALADSGRHRHRVHRAGRAL